MIETFDFEGEFADRTVGTQGGFQAAGVCVAIAFAVVGGAVVGEYIKCVDYVKVARRMMTYIFLDHFKLVVQTALFH